MDPIIAAAGISALANLGGGIMGANSAAAINAQQIAMQRDANFANMSFARESLDNSNFQAHVNRDFQWKMSSTAYQRAVADMRAAGLNPMLAYSQGGASTSGGATGTSPVGAGQSGVSGLQNPGEHLSKGIANAVHSAVDAAKTLQGVNLMKEQAKVAQEEAELKRRQQRNVDMDSAKKIEETFKTNAEIDVVKKMVGQVLANTSKAHAEAGAASASSKVTGQESVNMDRYGSRQAPSTWERIMRTIFGGGVASPSGGPRIEDWKF